MILTDAGVVAVEVAVEVLLTKAEVVAVEVLWAGAEVAFVGAGPAEVMMLRAGSVDDALLETDVSFHELSPKLDPRSTSPSGFSTPRIFATP